MNRQACIGFLLILVSTLRADEAKPAEDLAALAGRSCRTSWYGLYLLGQKAGWIQETLARTKVGGAFVYRYSLHVEAQVDQDGEQVGLRSDEAWDYEAAPPHRLLACESEDQEADGTRERVQGKRTPKGFVLAGKTVAPLKHGLSDRLAIPRLLASDPPPGTRISGWAFDPSDDPPGDREHTACVLLPGVCSSLRLALRKIETGSKAGIP